MRACIKMVNKGKRRFLFDGSSFALFEVVDEDALTRYLSGDDEEFTADESDGTLGKVVVNVCNMCNLSCRYCYAEGGNYGRQDHKMSKETFDTIISDLERSGVREIEVFSLFGGEPLINWPLVEYAIPKVTALFSIRNIEVVTNGTVLNEDMVYFLKKYNVLLSISIDGPEEITDVLRGDGVYRRAMDSLNLCKRINYPRLCISATYTKKHEDAGMSYTDLCHYLEKENVRMTVSRVITNDSDLSVQSRMDFAAMRSDIHSTLMNILHNNYATAVNPYVYNFLLSLVCHAKSQTFCDDLLANRSITYDFDGRKYNCFRFWNDKKYLLKDNTMNSEIVQANDKDQHVCCAGCWARNMCKVCVAAVMQGMDILPMKCGRCADQETFEIVLEEVLDIVQKGRHAELATNFFENFRIYL